MSTRFDLTVNDLPRGARVAIGRKGVLEIQFDRIPPHLLGGEDGLIVTGLKRLLADHCAGDSTIKNAQETLEAWYAGYRTRRAAGVSDVIETGARPARAKVDEALMLDTMQEVAVRRTGNEILRKASRRDLRRTLGGPTYTEIETIAKGILGKK